MGEIDIGYSTTRLLVRGNKNEYCNSKNQDFSLIKVPAYKKNKSEGGLKTQGCFKYDREDKPLITIITVVYNGDKNLEETIKSVINQSYDNIEYIIIDGGSTDGTLDIIEKYDKAINYWISEPDRGIADAFNKGVIASSGSYINFQGDGDGFYEEHVVENLAKDLDASKDILVSGKIIRIDENGKRLYVSKQPKKFSKISLLFKMSLPHQGLFTHRQFFEEYGLFDVNNKFCMDYEHLLRAYKKFPKVILKDIIVSKWRADGIGNNRELDIYHEYDAIKRGNNVAPRFYLFLINYFILLKFQVKRILFFIR